MSKKIAIAVISSLLMSQPVGFCADDKQIQALDEQRVNVLKEIISELIAGKMSPTDAQQLKTGLDGVVQLETAAQEDQNVSDSEYASIKSALDKVQSQVTSATSANKVWMGISSNNTSIQKKINDALTARKISKDQAVSLTEEEEKLRARESNVDSQTDFTMTLAVANDILALDGKIDQLASVGHTQ
jgi:hypothetical protein